jgi:hypothetical protein
MYIIPKVIQVIETEVTRGKGVVDDPFRGVRQYFTFEGVLLAEYDPCKSDDWKPGPTVTTPR